MLKVICRRCGGEHLIWECERKNPALLPPGVPDSPQIDQIAGNPEQRRFDKVAYQREYMRRRRAAGRA